jgi:hypothetical protein
MSSEEFIDKELRDTISSINTIIRECWYAAKSRYTNEDQRAWLSLAKDTCALKFELLNKTKRQKQEKSKVK